jgi:hypothetical protein
MSKVPTSLLRMNLRAKCMETKRNALPIIYQKKKRKKKKIVTTLYTMSPKQVQTNLSHFIPLNLGQAPSRTNLAARIGTDYYAGDEERRI